MWLKIMMMNISLEAMDETIMPAIKAPQLVEEDHFDSISPRDVAKNESLTDNFFKYIG